MKTLTFALSLIRQPGHRFPLSESGLQQAEAAGCYLKDVECSNVFSSNMLRAQQSFGIAEGRLVQDVREMAEAAGQSFPGFTPPKGETQEQVTQRVKEFLEKTFQQIGAEHWCDRGEEDETSSSSNPLSTSPAEGRADEGVRGFPVHALVITHGAHMCMAVRFLVEELGCSLPPGSDKEHVFALSPNTGLSRFLLTVRRAEGRFALSAIRCVFVHRKGGAFKSRS